MRESEQVTRVQGRCSPQKVAVSRLVMFVYHGTFTFRTDASAVKLRNDVALLRNHTNADLVPR